MVKSKVMQTRGFLFLSLVLIVLFAISSSIIAKEEDSRSNIAKFVQELEKQEKVGTPNTKPVQHQSSSPVLHQPSAKKPEPNNQLLSLHVSAYSETFPGVGLDFVSGFRVFDRWYMGIGGGVSQHPKTHRGKEENMTLINLAYDITYLPKSDGFTFYWGNKLKANKVFADHKTFRGDTVDGGVSGSYSFGMEPYLGVIIPTGKNMEIDIHIGYLFSKLPLKYKSGTNKDQIIATLDNSGPVISIGLIGY